MPRYTSMQNHIESQVKFWEHNKLKIDMEEGNKLSQPTLPFLTVSREYGCGGFEIGQRISQILTDEMKIEPAWMAYDKELLEKLQKDTGLTQPLIETLTNKARNTLTNAIQGLFSDLPPQVTVYQKLVEIVRILATNGHVIIIGRAGNIITRDMPNGYHIRLVADMEWKIDRISQAFSINARQAEKQILEKSKQREKFMQEYVHFDLSNPHNYDLVINNSRHDTEESARLITGAMKGRDLL